VRTKPRYNVAILSTQLPCNTPWGDAQLFLCIRVAKPGQFVEWSQAHYRSASQSEMEAKPCVASHDKRPPINLVFAQWVRTICRDVALVLVTGMCRMGLPESSISELHWICRVGSSVSLCRPWLCAISVCSMGEEEQLVSRYSISAWQSIVMKKILIQVQT
jgi:hypothetical protein